MKHQLFDSLQQFEIIYSILNLNNSFHANLFIKGSVLLFVCIIITSFCFITTLVIILFLCITVPLKHAMVYYLCKLSKIIWIFKILFFFILSYDFFIENGVILRPVGNIVYILPPYVITDAQLQKVYEVVESALEIV